MWRVNIIKSTLGYIIHFVLRYTFLLFLFNSSYHVIKNAYYTSSHIKNLCLAALAWCCALYYQYIHSHFSYVPESTMQPTVSLWALDPDSYYTCWSQVNYLLQMINGVHKTLKFFMANIVYLVIIILSL
jgi:hypothetical protein